MGIQTRSALKTTNRDFNNILDSAVFNQVKVLTAATDHVLTADDAGCTVVFNAAGATTVKLPTPQLGMTFDFITTVTATADHVIQAATNDHGFLGGVLIMNTTADQTNAFSAATDGNNDFITLNGTTTGGIAGTALRCVAILNESAAKCWAALGRGETAGNTASLNYTVTT